MFAAGNDGSYGHKTISNPALAKSCVTVGAAATQNPANVTNFSSLGPTADGRFGIDVIAPGYYLTSARASGVISSESCDTVTYFGTSMATPMVAASAALIRQYFMDATFWASICRSSYKMCGVFEPLASTVKAVLINSAFPAKNLATIKSLEVPPDPIQGYGHVDLLNVLPLFATSGTDLFVEEILLCEGDSVSFFVKVTSKLLPLRATIVWTDKPGMVGYGKQLKNDVDLVLISPSGRLYLGNGQIVKDSTNPVERVLIITPEIGTYTVIVSVGKGALTGSMNQTVSIVITCAGIVTYTHTTSTPSSAPTRKNSTSSSCFFGPNSYNIGNFSFGINADITMYI